MHRARFHPQYPLAARLLPLKILKMASSLAFWDGIYREGLGNVYPDGSTALSPHSDDEEGLADEFPIMGVTFGEQRDLTLHEITPDGKKGDRVATIRLKDGCWCIMWGDLQKTHLHGILATRAAGRQGARLNYTIRAMASDETKKYYIQLKQNLPPHVQQVFTNKEGTGGVILIDRDYDAADTTYEVKWRERYHPHVEDGFMQVLEAPQPKIRTPMGLRNVKRQFAWLSVDGTGRSYSFSGCTLQPKKGSKLFQCAREEALTHLVDYFNIMEIPPPKEWLSQRGETCSRTCYGDCFLCAPKEEEEEEEEEAAPAGPSVGLNWAEAEAAALAAEELQLLESRKRSRSHSLSLTIDDLLEMGLRNPKKHKVSEEDQKAADAFGMI